MAQGQHSFYHSKSWVASDSNAMRHGLNVRGKATVDEVLQEIASQGVDVDLVDLVFSGQIEWVSPASLEDLNRRRDNAKEAERRKEEYERSTYERLAKKYGGEL